MSRESGEQRKLEEQNKNDPKVEYHDMLTSTFSMKKSHPHWEASINRKTLSGVLSAIELFSGGEPAQDKRRQASQARPCQGTPIRRIMFV